MSSNLLLSLSEKRSRISPEDTDSYDTFTEHILLLLLFSGDSAAHFSLDTVIVRHDCHHLNLNLSNNERK